MTMSRETPLDIFRRACGLDGPLALAPQDVQSPDSPPQTIQCPGPFVFIGRHPKDDLVLRDRQVSRRHAYLQAVAGRVVGIDLKSRTGTFWDDRPEAQPWDWLDPGHSLRIGPYRIHRTDLGPNGDRSWGLTNPFAPTSGAGPVAGDWPGPALELPIRVAGVAPTWEMAGALALVGRADDCQLTLADDSISRTHACLIRTLLGTWVVDLGAREGVHVNGTRVRWAWLADGDLLRFGLFTMVLRYDRQPEGILRKDVPLEAGAFPKESSDEIWSDDPATSQAKGTELAVRSQPRPPGLRRRSGPPRVVSFVAAPAVGEGEWEPAVGPGPGSYAIWQQQMQLMETFHNDMAMMVQMFVAMHREFQTSVRDELARVQELTRELGRLNARLGQLPRSGGGTDAPEAALPEAARPDGKAPSVPRKSWAGPNASPRADSGRPVDATAGPPRKDRKDQPGQSGRSRKAPAETRQPEAGRPPGKGTSEMYADLTRRITQLQNERRGYWQRILKAINR
jgi:pSer/pThr/pTyr-binding forkhead associated (FHA) protein